MQHGAAGRQRGAQCTAGMAEAVCALLQEDGTLDSILGDMAALEGLLDALCGVTGTREQDSKIRAALAESIELLVSAAQLAHGVLLFGMSALSAVLHEERPLGLQRMLRCWHCTLLL